MVSLGPKVPNIAPELQNAAPKFPQGTKMGPKGIKNTCVRQTARSDYRNSRQASSQRYALRPWTPCLQKAAPTGKSSQACFVRTDHTASSQGHPSHTPQRIHPISYAKAISLQHISSSHPSTIPLRIECHARYLRTHSLHGASVEPPCLFAPNRNGHNHMYF